jgi:RecG-like helicase
MMALLQGDVGSGKTIVAATIAYYIHHLQKNKVFLLLLWKYWQINITKH